MGSKLTLAVLLAASVPRVCAASDESPPPAPSAGLPPASTGGPNGAPRPGHGSPSAGTPPASTGGPNEGSSAGNVAPSAAANAASSAGSLAEQRYREGDADMNRGSFEEARLAFVQAYALDPLPRYLWSLAVAEAKGDHPVEALAHLRQYLRLPSVTDDERRTAAVRMSEASAKTGHIRVETLPGATITVDSGFNAGVTPLADPIDVLPGRHSLVATRGGQTESTTIEPHAGETVVWQLQWAVLPGAVPAGPTAGSTARSFTPQPGSEGTTPNGKPLPTTKWIVAASLVAGGLVSFGVAGGVTAAGSNEASKESQLGAQTGVCTQPPMTPACVALKNAADAHAEDGNIALWFVGAGGALVAAGVLALVVWPAAKPTSSGFLMPIVTPTGGGAQWVQQF